jgi:hypothetical protein
MCYLFHSLEGLGGGGIINGYLLFIIECNGAEDSTCSQAEGSNRKIKKIHNKDLHNFISSINIKAI